MFSRRLNRRPPEVDAIRAARRHAHFTNQPGAHDCYRLATQSIVRDRAVVLRSGDQDSIDRAGAARNRRAVLAAAKMIMVDGADALYMDPVAAEAGVSVGTVYRRFGDRAGLTYALLDDEEQQFQAAFLFAHRRCARRVSVARICAFLHAYVDRLDTHASLLALAEALLAVIGAGLYLHHRQELQFSPDRIKTGLDQLLAGLAPAAPDVQSWPACADSV